MSFEYSRIVGAKSVVAVVCGGKSVVSMVCVCVCVCRRRRRRRSRIEEGEIVWSRLLWTVRCCVSHKLLSKSP